MMTLCFNQTHVSRVDDLGYRLAGGRGGCIDDDVLINSRELLGSSEITAYLSGLRQPGPLGRLGGDRLNEKQMPLVWWELLPLCNMQMARN